MRLERVGFMSENNQSKNTAAPLKGAGSAGLAGRQGANNTQDKSHDCITEMELSSKSTQVIEENDVMRKKKVAALKAEYQQGTLSAKPSIEIAKKLLSKLGL